MILGALSSVLFSVAVLAVVPPPEAFWTGTTNCAAIAEDWCVFRANGRDDAAGLEEARRARPDARFVLLGTLPVGGVASDPFSPENVAQRKANAALAKLADGKSVVFLDASDRFRLESGETDPTMVGADGSLPAKARDYLMRQFERLVRGSQQSAPANQRWRNLPWDDVPTLLYVSPEGDDAAAGTKVAPLKTLAGARDRIRSLRKKQGGTLPGGVIVTFLEGDYPFTSAVEFGAEDSGTPDSPVVYRAERPQAVRFTGAQRLAWRLNAATGLHEATIPGTDPLPGFYGSGCCTRESLMYIEHPVQLYLAGERLTCARWPNKGETAYIHDCYSDATDLGADTTWAERFQSGMISVAGPDGKVKDLSALAKDKDVWAFGLWFTHYADATAEVTEWDLARNAFRFDTRLVKHGWRRTAEMHFFNALSELDQPGEWVLDRAARRLYVKMPDGSEEMPVLSLVPSLIVARGLADVTFDGFLFEYSRCRALSFKDCRGITVRTSVVRHTSAEAIRIDGGAECRVEGCDMYDLGKGGVWMKGGALYTLNPCNHTVDNCHIHDFGRVTYNYQPAVSLNGTGCRATHNLIHHGRHQGIAFNGNLHEIGYNVLHDLCMHNNDAGAIYAYHTTGAWNMRGNVIEYNLIHMVGDQPRASMCEGIYLDAFVSGTTVRGNLVNRSTIGIFSSGGNANVIERNIVMRCSRGILKRNLGDGLHPCSRLGADSYIYYPLVRNREIFEMGFWKARYPDMLKPLSIADPVHAHDTFYASICSNALVATGEMIFTDKDAGADDSVTGPFCRVEGNVTLDADPGFVDYFGGNWELREDAPLRKTLGGGTRFGEMGLYPSALRVSPAVKYGKDMSPIRRLKREFAAAQVWLELHWQGALPEGVAECCRDRKDCEFLPWGEKGKVILKRAFRIPHETWTELSFSFVPTADGEIDFQIGGEWGEKTRYDDFRMTGATLVNGDFSDATGWTAVPPPADAAVFADVEPPYGIVEGCAVANEKLRLSQRIRVRKDVTVTCTFRAQAFDDLAEDFPKGCERRARKEK